MSPVHAVIEQALDAIHKHLGLLAWLSDDLETHFLESDSEHDVRGKDLAADLRRYSRDVEVVGGSLFPFAGACCT